ncbi:MAG: exosome complex exonuclease Rrp41 [Nitrososphaerota archaeon]|nr:exosome complex exonuclease Rrp41 [Nitrososphaerota archaeon]MDG6939560.1 exosome complex exonuclease Rrp41 [Nitrososphaerota archaeon]
MTELINARNIRIDGRKLDELRPIKLKVGVLNNADGSAYIEWGRNKIMAAVYGPKECHPKHKMLADRALLKCRYHMTPFSVDDRKPPQPSRREVELSKIIREALAPAILLEEFPRTAIEIYVEVLQSDGGSRVASITAASAALADAGIPMRDLVVGCAVGKVAGKIVADLNDTEDKEGDVDLPVACMPNLNLVTLLQSDGAMSKEDFEEAFKMALEKCRYVYDLQRQALLEGYTPQKEDE